RRSRSSSLFPYTTLFRSICVGGALAAPWISPQDPFDVAVLNLSEAFKPPAWLPEGERAYLLGSDNQGRDILSTIMHGARISLGRSEEHTSELQSRVDIVC